MITEEQIQHHFIDRFQETHGEAPDTFAAAFWKRLPKDTTLDALEAASEHIIRTKRTKSFPSYSECLDVIAEMARNKVVTPIAGARRSITNENYVTEALAFMKAHRRGDQIGAMIEPGTPEWSLWVAYFIAKQIPSLRMARIEAFARHKTAEGEVEWRVTDRFMVPARYPMEFDASAPAIPTTWGDHAAKQHRRSTITEAAA